MLLAVIVKQRLKRSSDSDRHDHKRSKTDKSDLAKVKKSSSKDTGSYTPPTSGKGKQKSYTPPKLKSILKKGEDLHVQLNLP